LIRIGLDADKPAPGIMRRFYYATDTKILYYDMEVAWVEACRGETAIRLTQLLEKSHTSLTSVLANQHPNTKVRTKVVNEAAIADGKVLQYNATSGELEYVTLPKIGAPDYDSGWVAISADEEKEFTHNLGTDNCFVDIQGKRPTPIFIHQIAIGGREHPTSATSYTSLGAEWRKLTSTTVAVHRKPDDGNWVEVRVRIWKLE